MGGIDLASEWAGFTTVGQCELADYPYKVLCKHWPDVPKWRDIRDVTAESIKHVGPTSLISAGYPCQPFSLAGKRKGKDDDRHLWPEVYRLLKEINPTWFIGENVVGHVTMGLDTVLSDLENIGYACQPFIIPACASNAVHIRERVFVLAHSTGTQCTSGAEIEGLLRTLPENGAIIDYIDGPSEAQSREDVADADWSGLKEQWRAESMGTELSAPKCCGKNVANSAIEGLSKCGQPGFAETDKEEKAGMVPKLERCGKSAGKQRATKPGLGRMPDGAPNRVHRPPVPLGCEQYEWEPPRVAKGIKDRRQRLECLGNMVMPYQVYPILKAIYEIESR